MIAPLANAVKAHFRKLKALAGVTAVYRQGVMDTGDITVVPASRIATTETYEGMAIQTRDRDILVQADELVINGATVLPLRMDQIDLKDDQGNVTETLVVDSSPAYSNSDGYGLVVRVHCKQTI